MLNVACLLVRSFRIAQRLRAFASSFSQLLSQSFDNAMVEACFVRTRTCGVYFIRELPGHPFESFDQRVGVHACLARELLPVAQPNLAELVFAADLHGELDLAQVEFIVW